MHDGRTLTPKHAPNRRYNKYRASGDKWDRCEREQPTPRQARRAATTVNPARTFLEQQARAGAAGVVDLKRSSAFLGPLDRYRSTRRAEDLEGSYR